MAALLNALPNVTTTTLVPMSTRGDEILDRSLQKIGGKGLFIKELEIAMQDGRADLAVHSMKDVPAELPDGFCLAATLSRANCADALVSSNRKTLMELRNGACIGSSSLRRQAQLKMMRPDISVLPLRGNINTRLEKFENGDYDAIVLAAAGLERLQLEHHISQEFTPGEMLPAAAQGVLGLECLESSSALRAILAQLDDPITLQTTAAERAIARLLQANCQSPVAAHAVIAANTLTLTALVAHPDGSNSIRATESGATTDGEAIGVTLAAKLLQEGARELLDAIEATHGE